MVGVGVLSIVRPRGGIYALIIQDHRTGSLWPGANDFHVYPWLTVQRALAGIILL
jgi:hypothetical protein